MMDVRTKNYNVSNPNNIGAMKWNKYWQLMKKVYSKCHFLLKDDGKMVLITKDYCKNNKIVPFTEKTVSLCNNEGFRLIDRWYRRIENYSLFRVFQVKNWYKDNPTKPIHIPLYEDILIFSNS